MSRNAFNTDHRWLRLLHDYVKMYAQIHGRHLPEHLDAMQLIVEMDMVSDQAPADAVLKKGMSVHINHIPFINAIHPIIVIITVQLATHIL